MKTHKDCGGELEPDKSTSGPWGTLYKCKKCGATALGTYQIDNGTGVRNARDGMKLGQQRYGSLHNMVSGGRTIREGIEAGNMYQLSGPGGFNYMPPAATTPDEVINWAKQKFQLRKGTYTVERIVGGSIGGFFVETVRTFEIK